MMETTQNISQEFCEPINGKSRDLQFGYEVQSKLNNYISYPWISVVESMGIHVLLLSRKEEKSVQRDVFFSYSGEEKITVHCKPIPKDLSAALLEGTRCIDILSTERRLNDFAQRILTVVKRLQRYEVCVGIDDIDYKPLWEFEKDGEIENDVFKELRYQLTFRPKGCHLIVNGDSYLKRRCPVCVKTKIRFRSKKSRHRDCVTSPSTPNIHLHRDQLLRKLSVQQKKLKYNRDQISRLKLKLQKATSLKGITITDSLSEELVNICMNFIDCNV